MAINYALPVSPCPNGAVCPTSLKKLSAIHKRGILIRSYGEAGHGKPAWVYAR